MGNFIKHFENESKGFETNQKHNPCKMRKNDSQQAGRPKMIKIDEREREKNERGKFNNCWELCLDGI